MFEVGDVVVCIIAGPSIREGEVCRIVGFRVGPETSLLGKSSLGIFLKGKTSTGRKGSYAADRFRKLPPAEPEFINLIRGLKAPTKIREDA